MLLKVFWINLKKWIHLQKKKKTNPVGVWASNIGMIFHNMTETHPCHYSFAEDHQSKGLIYAYILHLLLMRSLVTWKYYHPHTRKVLFTCHNFMRLVHHSAFCWPMLAFTIPFDSSLHEDFWFRRPVCVDFPGKILLHVWKFCYGLFTIRNGEEKTYTAMQITHSSTRWKFVVLFPMCGVIRRAK